MYIFQKNLPDIYLGLKLNDTQVAKDFIMKVFAKMSQEMVGRDNVSFGLFSVSGTRPLKNTYRDIEYYLVPTGFVNGYYTFLDDTFYLSISQLSINKLIDAYLDDKGKSADEIYSAAVRSGINAIGTKHNIVLHADGEKMKKWYENAADEYGGRIDTYYYSSRLSGDFAYLSEAQTLAQTFSDYDGTLSNVEGKYYQYIPKKFFGGEYVIENDSAMLSFNGQSYDRKEIDDDVLRDIQEEETIDAKIKNWDVIKNVSVGLKITPEGIDSKLAMNNPLRDVKDESIIQSKSVFETTKKNSKLAIPWLWMGIIISIIVLIGIFMVLCLFYLKQKKQKPPLQSSSNPPEAPLPPNNPRG